MKKRFLKGIVYLLITFSTLNLQAQTNPKLMDEIIGTWILQKVELRINPNAKEYAQMSKEDWEKTRAMQASMMPPFPEKRDAFLFEKGGKLKLVNSMTKPESTTQGTWELSGKALSIKSEGELFRNVVVNIDKEIMDFTIIAPTGQFTADSPITMHAVLKKGTLKDLDYSEISMPTMRDEKPREEKLIEDGPRLEDKPREEKLIEEKPSKKKNKKEKKK